ncbi:undecaprenyl-phosphate glucose phosphotransferase [Phycisphaeraceae bacterium AH-315-B13]|nr:undecaprenyl-phosphate glucose phosphotransferase [Phycisphaeraceae bacterium AH-315-B13]
MVKQRHQLFVAILCLSDAAVVMLACYLAWLLRLYIAADPDPITLARAIREPLAFLVVPAVLYAMWGFRLYTPRRDQSILSEVGQVVRAIIGAMAAIVVLLWVIGSSLINQSPGVTVITVGSLGLDASRLQLAILAITLVFTLSAERLTLRSVLRSLRKRGKNLRHACVVGVGRLGQITCHTLDRNSWTGISVAYFIGHRETTKRTECLSRPVLGGINDLEHALEEREVDAVYLALPSSRASEIPGLIKRLERFAVDVRIIPDVNPRHMPQNMMVSELDGMPILSVRESPLYGVGGVSKRFVDIAGAVCCIILFAPLLALIALLVRMSGSGPVIFRQRRVSLGGETFNIYKFRTMAHVEDEEPARWTTRNDPRVTRIGQWLRKTSLDELPQLLNVLRGDMSLVGPRPERPELIQQFREDWRGYMLRQHVKAGMTGWAQVNGLRGDTSIKKRIQYDLFYVRHWSIGFDIRILFLTLSRGFVHRNAH